MRGLALRALSGALPAEAASCAGTEARPSRNCSIEVLEAVKALCHGLISAPLLLCSIHFAFVTAVLGPSPCRLLNHKSASENALSVRTKLPEGPLYFAASGMLCPRKHLQAPGKHAEPV